ncbi:hypothetical protein PAAG_08113 [Paracoccidioides lutzii Pb01]|uniref:Myb-like DNA-binding domain-containing protein n=1 Tax=Paracoccidioides lutzii (strain ATCC MYA-826 / Pb01) TaxID=502779 RepID=C1HBH2_PARBA|nr:hypothetical protein PAAG_08113 [Paracoccidioides lutzii Pb01]EEH37695.1 hypothetical protein PAAG_08113 [Paracoccidioides lutzii Pb01]
MSRISSDEQLNFLLKCVKHSSNGKVDFTEVAAECNIVSKGAAAKRYERLMKANGINPNDGPASGTDEPSLHEASSNGTTPKKSTPKTPARPTIASGTKTPFTPKRKTSIKANNTEKKVKIEDTDSDNAIPSKGPIKCESVDANVFGVEGQEVAMKSLNDPVLSEGSGLAGITFDHEEGYLYNEFCAINALPKGPASGGSGGDGSFAHGGNAAGYKGPEDGELGILEAGDSEI